jgi:hypothetical protein
MLVVNYMCRMWHKYYFLCNFLITLFNPFRSIFIRSSNVLIIYVKSIIYIYSAAIYYNSDIVVMSRGNKKKIHLHLFIKGRAFYCLALWYGIHSGLYHGTNLMSIYALCGGFGVYCGNSSSPYECLKGFEPFSMNYTRLNDWSGGCVRKSPLQCENNTYGNGTKDWFMKMPNVRLHVNSKAYNWAASARIHCEAACINHCSCTAYAYNRSGYCMIWE